MKSIGYKLLVVCWSGFLAFVILIVGQGVWGMLLAVNFSRGPALPWSVPLMAVFLWLLWAYLGGEGWPRSTSQARHRLLRARRVSRESLGLAFIAGVLAITALAGCWIVFVQLVRTPANVLPDLSRYPLPTVILVVAMASLVSPIVEEAGFRGYCQQKLEEEFHGPAAVAISSALFMLAHAHHGWFWPKLAVYFLVGVVFGAIVYFTDSILASIPVHIVGDVTFFTLVWPHDGARRLVTEGGADAWFWIHVAQAVVFTVLALMVFRRLAGRSHQEYQSSA